MKKKNLLVVPLLALSFLTGCNQKDNLIVLERSSSYVKPVELKSYKDLNTMISRSQSFVLATYNNSCLCSLDFYSKILNPIIKDYNIKIYRIIETEFASVAGLSFTPNTPELMIYNKGELVSHVSAYKKWENKADNKDKVIKHLQKYCFLDSPFRYVTKEELESLIKTKKEVLVYFTLNVCPDCLMFDDMFLNSYIKDDNNKDKLIYVFETSPYRLNPDENVWKEVAQEFNLSKESNSKFGYRHGVVPTLQYYKDGILNDVAIIYNDEYEPIGTSDQIKVTTGYYHQFDNVTYSSKEEYRNETFDFYKQKFIDLVSKVYKK